MTDEQKFLVKLAALSTACRFNMTPELTRAYYTGLKPMGWAKASEAIDQILVNRRGNDYMPSIRDIADRIEPSQSIQGATQELVTRVLYAVRRFGYCDPSGARRYVGEIVWEALPGDSGWVSFCEEEGGSGSGVAQLRDRIAAFLGKRFPSGRVQLAPPEEPPEIRIPIVIADVKVPLLVSHDMKQVIPILPAVDTPVELTPAEREKNKQRQLEQLRGMGDGDHHGGRSGGTTQDAG